HAQREPKAWASYQRLMMERCSIRSAEIGAFRLFRVTKLSHRPSTLPDLFCRGAPPVANFLPRSIALTMFVSFTISFAVMFWQRKAQEKSVPMVDATPSLAMSASAAAPARPPIAEHQETV